MDKETIRRIAAVTLIIALIIIGAPLKVTMHAQAGISPVEDPLDAAIAPHFSKVVYSLVAPAYSTSCDARGHLKALTGTPTIAVNDSRVVLSAISTGPNSMVLSKTDVPAINKTTAHYQMAFNVSNALSWANISLYDNHKDWINISIHSGVFYSDYDSGTRQLAVFYSPAAAGTDYMVAFDLTPSSVTLYLYSSAGVLLADKYISNARLVGGDLDEIRWELAGSSSAKLRLDYFYVANSSGAAEISDPTALGVIHTDDDLEVGRCDLDPTTLTMDQGLREDLFGLTSTPPDDSVTKEEVYTAMGTTELHQQRVAGRLVATGYHNLGSSVENAIEEYIADLESVEEDQIYLVDYYIDYTQMKIGIDRTIVDNMQRAVDDAMPAVIEESGGTLVDYGATVSTLTLPARATGAHITNSGVGVVGPAYLNDVGTGKRYSFWEDPLGTKQAAADYNAWMAQVYGDTWSAYRDTGARLDQAYNDTKELVDGFMESTDEQFDQLNENFMGFMSFSNAQMQMLSSDYSESMDKFERSISKFYSYAENQFEATNSVMAKLLLQNEVLSNGSQRINEYFAGELARSNEVVMNLTSSLVNSLSPGNYWSQVVQGGKAQDAPLTFSGIFGNSMQTWTWIIIIGILSIVAIVIIVSLMRPRRTRNRKS